jgi:hypothetical protein
MPDERSVFSSLIYHKTGPYYKSNSIWTHCIPAFWIFCLSVFIPVLLLFCYIFLYRTKAGSRRSVFVFSLSYSGKYPWASTLSLSARMPWGSFGLSCALATTPSEDALRSTTFRLERRQWVIMLYIFIFWFALSEMCGENSDNLQTGRWS